MKTIYGDLLEGDWDYFCHVTNSFQTFGSGIAYYVKKKFPEVYQADLDYDAEDKLGTYSYADLADGRGAYNIYAMYGLGNDGTHLGRNLSYDAFTNALENICSELSNNHYMWSSIRIGVPYLIGCCRAGGNWNIVRVILETLESEYPNIEFIVYDIENGEKEAQSTQPNNSLNTKG